MSGKASKHGVGLVMNVPPPERFLAIDGCFNFRDLGGYRTEDGRTVRWRRLYRSDQLHRISVAGSMTFRELGIVTVLDLRSRREVEEGRWRPPPGWSGRWVNIPLLAETPDWRTADPEELAADDFVTNHYLHIATVGAAGLRDSVETLVQPGGLPAVFHCAAGKDRTGVLAALVLRLLGVRAEDIADDYALSELATARWERALGNGLPADDNVTTWPYIPPVMHRSDRRSVLTFLRYLDQGFGSIGHFAAHLGIGAATIRRLRSALLD